MDFKKTLTESSTAEARAFINDNAGNPDFLKFIAGNTKWFIKASIKAKVLRDDILPELSKETLSLICEEMITNSFFPGKPILNHFIVHRMDEELNRVYTAFPSVTVELPDAVKLSQMSMGETVISLLLDGRFVVTEDNATTVLSDSVLSSKRFVDVIKDTNDWSEIIDLTIGSRNKYGVLDQKALLKIINGSNISPNRYGLSKFVPKTGVDIVGFRKIVGLDCEIEWSNDYLEVEFHECKSINLKFTTKPPKSTIFYLYFQSYGSHISELTAVQAYKLFKIYTSRYQTPHKERELLGLILSEGDFYKEIPVSSLNRQSNYVSGMIRDRDIEVIQYLYVKGGSSLKAGLTRSFGKKAKPVRLGKDGEVAAPGTKKVFFDEILAAIKSNNAEEAREYVAKGYTLERFATDSFQSTKAPKLQQRSWSLDQFSSFTKIEFLELFDMNVESFSFWSHKKQKAPFTFTLSEIESKEMWKKIETGTLIKLSEDQKETFKFLVAKGECKDLVNDIVNSDNPTRELKKYSSTVKLDDIIEHSDAYDLDEQCSAHLTSKTMRARFLKDLIPVSQLSKIMFVLNSDGERFITDKEIKEVFIKSGYEIDSWIEAMSKNLPEFTQEFAKDYVKGGTVLEGRIKAKIRRSKISEYTALAGASDKPEDSLEVRIQKGRAFLEEIVKAGLDPVKQLKDAGAVTIKVKRLTSLQPLMFLESCPKVSVDVYELKNTQRYNRSDVAPNADCMSRVSFRAIEVEGMAHVLDHVFLGNLENTKFICGGVMAARVIGKAKKASKKIKNYDELVEIVTSEFNANSNYWDNDLDVVIDLVPYLTTELVERVITVKGIDGVKELVKRKGTLDGIVLLRKKLDDSVIKFAEKNGAKIFDTDGFAVNTILTEIFNQGEFQFKSVSIESLSTPNKVRLIDFMEKQVDPRFKSLNLTSKRLDLFLEVSNYEDMKRDILITDEEFYSEFLIPESIRKNKKLLKGIQNLYLLKPNLVTKIRRVRELKEIIAPNVELDLSDFLDYSDHNSPVEEEGLSVVQVDAISVVVSSMAQYVNSELNVLRNLDKKSFGRFIRSCSSSYLVNDTFGMMETILRGVKAQRATVEEILETPKAERADNWKEEIDTLNTSAEGILKRFNEVSSLDSIRAIHERLVPVLQFIKTNPLEGLGQKKFNHVASVRRFKVEFGYLPMFPTTRGELQEMGKTHGWCVAHYSYYADSVISKGDVIFGLIPKDKEIITENLIALAYFTKNGQSYELNQIRWSSLTGKDTHADASKDFDVRAISNFLKDISERKSPFNKENQEEAA